jgi:hypothetical protein
MADYEGYDPRDMARLMLPILYRLAGEDAIRGLENRWGIIFPRDGAEEVLFSEGQFSETQGPLSALANYLFDNGPFPIHLSEETVFPLRDYVNSHQEGLAGMRNFFEAIRLDVLSHLANLEFEREQAREQARQTYAGAAANYARRYAGAAANFARHHADAAVGAVADAAGAASSSIGRLIFGNNSNNNNNIYNIANVDFLGRPRNAAGTAGNNSNNIGFSLHQGKPGGSRKMRRAKKGRKHFRRKGTRKHYVGKRHRA